MYSFTSCLRQIIVLQEAILEDDAMGGKLESWKDFLTLSAEVKALNELNPKETFSSMQIIDKSLYRFRIRYTTKVKPNMRIVYDQKTFQIKRIINHEERNTIAVIIAQEML